MAQRENTSLGQDATSLLTTMTNKAKALTNDVDMSSMVTPLIGTASDGRNKGAHQEITFASAEIVGANLVTTYNVGSGASLINCTPTSFDIAHAGVNQTISGCTPGSPQSNTVTTTMAAAPAAGAAVTLTGSYGAVQANRHRQPL